MSVQGVPSGPKIVCVYLEKTGLEHLEDGVHGVRDAGLAAVAPFVNGVVLGLALRAGDAARISLVFNKIWLLFKCIFILSENQLKLSRKCETYSWAYLFSLIIMPISHGSCTHSKAFK